MTKITQAFIFAAGRGERMRPLTDSVPKPLIKINGKAIIDYAIEKLDNIESIKKIIINGFYLADQIEEHIKKLNNPKIVFSREIDKVLLGLKKVEDYVGYEGNVHGGGDFDLADDKIFRFPDSPMTHVFVGTQIINPKILERAPEKCFSMSYFYRSAVGEGGLVHRIQGIELKGKYFHIGTIAAIKQTEEELSDAL